MALSVLLTAVPMTAQTHGDLPVFRTTTRLVEVRLVALDDKGPISDLTIHDFRVLDNGVERRIAFFSVGSAQARKSDTRAEAALPAGTFTNNPERRSDAPGRLLVVLIDGLNTHLGDQVRARDEFAKYVREMQARDRMALFALGNSLRLLQDFTSDRDRLIRAAARVDFAALPPGPGNAGRDKGDGGPEALKKVLSQTYAMEAAAHASARAMTTQRAIKSLSDALAPIAGRKSLIWLSGSFPFEMYLHPPSVPSSDYAPNARELDAELTPAMRAALKSGLAFYPVDLNGVLTEAPVAGQETIRALADFTGGKALFSNNNVLQGMRQAAEDSSVVYTIGFYPDAADGKFHKLEISTGRRGAQLRYQQGYFADGGATKNDRFGGRERMRNAMLDPFDQSDVRFTLSRELIGPEPARALKVRLTIAPGDLQLSESGDVWRATLDLAFSIRDKAGRDLDHDGTQLNLEFSKKGYETVRKDGVSLSREIKLKAEAAEVRLVLFDRISGRVGSLSFPVR